MTIEILTAVRDYIEEIAREKELLTVDDLLRAIEQDIQDKRRISEIIWTKPLSIKGLRSELFI